MYEWHIKTSPVNEVRLNLGVNGRANSKERPYVYLYGEEADNPASGVHINFDYLDRFLHRRLLQITRSFSENPCEMPYPVLAWEFSIDFETAKAFRKLHGKYLRANQWEDITVEVRVS